MINIERLSQIIITVSDIDASRAFYGKVLGLPQLFDRDLHDGNVKAVGFTVSSNVVVELIQITGVPPESASSTGPTLAFSVKDLGACKAVLAEKNIDVFNEMAVDGIQMLFFKDPDGNTIECSQFPGAAQCAFDMNQ